MDATTGRGGGAQGTAIAMEEAGSAAEVAGAGAVFHFFQRRLYARIADGRGVGAATGDA